MKFHCAWLVLMIMLLVFLVPSPSVALEQSLDTAAATPIEITAEKGFRPKAEAYLSATQYADPTLTVTLEEDRYLETDLWIARIQIAHPSQLRTAMAGRYGSQQTATAHQIAKRMDAVVAINGDYFHYVNYGVVLRQGHLYRNRPFAECDILMIDDEGNFHPVLHADEATFAAAYEALGGAYDEGGKIVNTFTFGPVLIQNGQLAHEEFYRPDGSENKLAQRIVIAQVAPLSYLFVACAGPESRNSEGLTLQQMADYMLSLGCETAYNLDGGSSSSLVFNGAKINSLDTGKIRSVSDIIYFSTGISDAEVTAP